MSATTPTAAPPPAPKAKDRKLRTLVENIAFGGTAGVIGQACVFPMYVAKTRLQSNPGRYRGMGQCFREILKESGTRGLYTGLQPTLSFTFPEKAIKLAVNDYLRAVFAGPDGSVPLAKGMAAGAGAGFCQVIMTNPMEMLMITMQNRQAQKLPKRSMVQLARELGLARLYRDTPSTLFRDIPFSIVFFPMHQTLQDYFRDEKGDVHFTKVLLSGLISGCTAATISTPMDVVKTLAMGSSGSKNPMGIMQAIRHVYSQPKGLAGFMEGVGPRILIISPLFGITTCFYEVQKKLRQKGWL